MTIVVSKLGIHSEGAQNVGLQDYLRALRDAGRRPAVVDSHDNYSATFDAASVDADTLTIGDLTEFEADFDIDLLRQKAAQNPHIKAWQIYNEINGDWDGQADRLIAIMNQYGHEFQFVIFNCADGTPPYPSEDGGVAYAAIARACVVAKAGGHMLGLHGYGFDIEDHLFRYRDLAEYLRVRNALCDIVLTEYGPDEGTFIGDLAFMTWCRMVDAELMKDDYIIGAALWTMGRGAWSGVDFSSALPQLAEYQISVETPVTIEPTPDGDFIGYDPVLVDEIGNEWRLIGERKEAGRVVLKNDAQHFGGLGVALLHYNGAVYVTNAQAEWYKALETGWQKVDGDPREQVTPPVTDPFWVAWPVGGSESPRITDKFNAPRNYANGKHEGLDCDAFINATAKNASILAAQDGIVEFVRTRTDNPSYGKHIVIRHPWGTESARYRTLYAHLSSIGVTEGQQVTRGQQIGVSGATGTSAIHLHFGVYDAVNGLRGYVRCIDCSATWPEGVIDPESVLRYSGGTNPTVLRGLHMQADGHSGNADFTCLHVAKLNAAKIMTNTGFDELARLITEGIKPENIVLRLYAAGDNPSLRNSQQFFNEQYAWLAEFKRVGGRYVEIHNEPNHPDEGMGTAWASAYQFGGWYESVARLIRASFPMLLIGWPGLWPNAASTPDFIAAMKASINIGLVDWIGAHSYWANSAGVDDPENGRWYRRLLGLGKPVLITEFCNNQIFDSDDVKGAQYKRYYATLDQGVLGAFAFVSSASAQQFNTTRQTWVRNGALTAIPSAVGS